MWYELLARAFICLLIINFIIVVALCKFNSAYKLLLYCLLVMLMFSFSVTEVIGFFSNLSPVLPSIDLVGEKKLNKKKDLPEMTATLYAKLSDGDGLPIPGELCEIGWHFCSEFDCLLTQGEIVTNGRCICGYKTLKPDCDPNQLIIDLEDDK